MLFVNLRSLSRFINVLLSQKTVNIVLHLRKTYDFDNIQPYFVQMKFKGLVNSGYNKADNNTEGN